MQPYTGMIDADKPNYGPLLIILAGCFWGSMGIFVRKLGLYGFTSVQIVSIRLTLAAIVFCIMLLIKDPSGFLISFRDIPLFFGLGEGSVLFFAVCYFMAITMMPLSTAAILLYTSPIWIMLMSVLFFHEKLTGKKLFEIGIISSKDSLALICGAVFSFTRKISMPPPVSGGAIL